MRSKSFIFPLFSLTCLVWMLSGCGLLFGLFYKDWQSETAYRSSSSKKNYYIIEGVTQSHCGCSDIVVKNYKDKKPDFTFYYGGGLFPAKKYVYHYHQNATDTLIFIPVETGNFDTPLDSLDNAILHQIDTLIATRPKGPGLIYKVKQHSYIGLIRQQ